VGLNSNGIESDVLGDDYNEGADASLDVHEVATDGTGDKV
jgi:hypothetical protein